MFHRPSYFKIEELVYPDLLCKLGVELTWRLIDPYMLVTLDMLREMWGRIRINDWDNNVFFRGLRPYDCEVGAEYSMHKFGKGFDLTFLDSDNESVRQDILANKYKREYKYITAIEIKVPHVHIDNRNYSGLLIINPNKVVNGHAQPETT